MTSPRRSHKSSENESIKRSSRESQPSAKVIQAAAQEAELVNARAEKQAEKEKHNRKQRRNQVNNNADDSVDEDVNDDPVQDSRSGSRGCSQSQDHGSSDDEGRVRGRGRGLTRTSHHHPRQSRSSSDSSRSSSRDSQDQSRDSDMISRKRHASSSPSLRVSQIPKMVTSGRPKAGNYDDFTQGMIYLAIGQYRLQISSQHAFPSSSVETEFLRKLCNVALISAVSSRQRARPLVEASFGFETGEHRKIIKKNCERAEFLKEDHRFLYKYPSEELENCKGLYQNPLIQKIVNAMWFQNKHDEGIKFMEIFNPFPIPVLALIDCCLDEWMTGIKTDAPFKAKFYSDIYEGHLKNLRIFDEQSRKSRSGLCDAILVKLHNRGRFNAGAQPASTLNFPSLSHHAFELDIKEYLNDPLTDTDGENGPSDND
ncbi:hypothetical protein H0H92_014713 [Tricholoma furcatifolium]|nr:hypothetical protein H0H92_014713 [Tricholoma furcatifolium]